MFIADPGNKHSPTTAATTSVPRSNMQNNVRKASLPGSENRRNITQASFETVHTLGTSDNPESKKQPKSQTRGLPSHDGHGETLQTE